MTKNAMTPLLIALFGLTLILLFQVSSLCLLIYLSSPLPERGSGRDKVIASTEDATETPVKAGDGRRDA